MELRIDSATSSVRNTYEFRDLLRHRHRGDCAVDEKEIDEFCDRYSNKLIFDEKRRVNMRYTTLRLGAILFMILEMFLSSLILPENARQPFSLIAERVVVAIVAMAHLAGDNLKSRTYFQKSIEQNESYSNDPSTVSPIGLGQILLEEGKDVEAEIYLSHALEINLSEIKGGSQDDDPLFYIAGIYAIRGQREEALHCLTKAIEATWIDYAQVEEGRWFVKYRKDPEVISMIDSLHKKAAVMRKRAEGM